MTPRFVLVGDVMIDVVAVAATDFARGSDTPARIGTYPGGSAANVACWLACAGAPAAFVGRIGSDLLGRTAEESLRRSGVVPYLAVDETLPTGTCIVLVTPDGERSMLPDPGANTSLDQSDIPKALLAQGMHLHLSGYTLLREGPRAAGLDAIARAKAAGMTISIDPSSEAMLRRAGAATFLDWVRDVDALLPNADEARLLSGCEDPLDAAMALTEIATQVVVTLGADGALWAGRSNPDPVHVPASPVDVVDTTGAGDAFAAGWLVSSLAGSRPEVALAEACGLAARAVSQVGARPR